MICILCSQCCVYFQKCIFITLGFTLNVLKDHPVLLLWIVIIVRVYWILTTTTITIRNHNIRILAPFCFRNPTSFQCFQTGKLGHYQNTKLEKIMIIKILVLFFAPDFSLHELLLVRMLRVYRYKVDFVCLAYQWPSYSLSGDRLSGCDREILAVMNKNSILAALKVRIRTEVGEFSNWRPHSPKIVPASKYLLLY